MYKVIINKDIIKEFKDVDKAMEYYGDNFKSADSIKMFKDNKLIAKKDK